MNLTRLTVAKTVANTALRWIPPFLPELQSAFGASTRQLTTIIGVGEMAGLSTIGVGRHLDRGRERLVMTLALACVSVASLVSLVGTTFSFAIGFVLVILGVANCTVAGHAYISHRVAYSRRARSIGLYETSWALALLIGAPVIALLIARFGWRGPFVMLAIASALVSVMVWYSPEQAPLDDATTSRSESASLASSVSALGLKAWSVVLGSAMLAMGGLSVFAISGSWLDQAFRVETGGLGAVAMGYGAIELLASTSSASFADRVGKLRATVGGIIVMLAGLGVMSAADSTLWIGVVGMLTLLCGFEFAFVTSLSLVTEAMPESRGTTIALANGVGTVARGTGTIASGWLFSVHGIDGTLTLSACAATIAMAAFVVSRRARA